MNHIIYNLKNNHETRKKKYLAVGRMYIPLKKYIYTKFATHLQRYNDHVK